MNVLPPTDAQEVARFDLRGNTPETWIMSADGLLAGARILRNTHSAAVWKSTQIVDEPIGTPVPPEELVLPPSFLLYGYALENLLKALWLRRAPINKLAINGSFNQSKDKNGQKVKSHCLNSLVEVVEFPVNNDEKLTLESLSAKLTSAGRYPIATNWKQDRTIPIAPSGLSSQRSFNTSDLDIVEGIVERLYKKLGC